MIRQLRRFGGFMTSTSVPDTGIASPIHLVPKLQTRPALVSLTNQQDPNALIVISFASIVAFHFTAILTGAMAGWMYSWQNLGGFAP
jgi:hypothetical protein